MSWKSEIIVNGKVHWHDDDHCFATEQEARSFAREYLDVWVTHGRKPWMLVIDWRAVESPDPINCRWVDGRPIAIMI